MVTECCASRPEGLVNMYLESLTMLSSFGKIPECSFFYYFYYNGYDGCLCHVSTAGSGRFKARQQRWEAELCLADQLECSRDLIKVGRRAACGWQMDKDATILLFYLPICG